MGSRLSAVQRLIHRDRVHHFHDPDLECFTNRLRCPPRAGSNGDAGDWYQLSDNSKWFWGYCAQRCWLHPGRLHLLARQPLLLSFSFFQERLRTHCAGLSMPLFIFHMEKIAGHSHGGYGCLCTNSFIAFIATFYYLTREQNNRTQRARKTVMLLPQSIAPTKHVI